MKERSCAGRSAKGCAETLFAYIRWLAVWGGALSLLLRRGRLADRLVWAEDAAAERLLRGFPALLAVPVSLFGEAARLVPGDCRVAAAGKDEEELLALIRRVEQAFGLRFDWDAFLSALDRSARRAAALEALIRALDALRRQPPGAPSPAAALAGLGSGAGSPAPDGERLALARRPK